MDTPGYRPEAHLRLARRVRDARRARRPLMHQAEAADLFHLSQSAYSRLENGDTKRWTVKARVGAAAIIGTTVEKIAADLDGEDVNVNTLTEVGILLQRIASDTTANRAMLNELIATRYSRDPC